MLMIMVSYAVAGGGWGVGKWTGRLEEGTRPTDCVRIGRLLITLHEGN